LAQRERRRYDEADLLPAWLGEKDVRIVSVEARRLEEILQEDKATEYRRRLEGLWLNLVDAHTSFQTMA